MDTTIQKNFFKAFEFGGVVHNCIDYFRQKYDLGYLPQINKKLPPKWMKFYNETLPAKILEATEAFDDSVIIYNDSPLMDEIEQCLKECKTPQEQDRYLFSLLKPFKQYSDIYTPIATINRLNKDIEKCKQNKAYWGSMPEDEILTDVDGKPSGTPQEQAKACDSFIDKYQKEIERTNYINRRFIEITCGQINDKNTVEYCLSTFVSVKTMFANRLDALLLLYGIDLMRLQKESGIYLKSYRLITDVDWYIGSMELAQKYIDALPKLESDTETTAETATTNSDKYTDEADSHFISDYNTEEIKQLFDDLINGKYLHKGTPFEAWKYVCGVGVQKPEGFEPINWIKEQGLLGFMVNTLFGDINKQNYWSITENAFVVKGRKPNINSMKNTLSKIANNWKDKSQKFEDLHQILVNYI